MSKSKLFRLKKDDLVDMLETRGAPTDGKKQDLVERIWELDNAAQEAEEEGDEVGPVRVARQAIATRTDRVAKRDDPEQAVVLSLREKILQLNMRLDSVRQALESSVDEHNRDQANVEQQIEELKELWANNLQAISEKMETAIRLQGSHEEMRTKQDILLEQVAQLQRLLALRDEEVKSLTLTLEQIRVDSADSARLRKQEQIALLALAGQAQAAVGAAASEGLLRVPAASPYWLPEMAGWPAPPAATPEGVKRELRIPTFRLPAQRKDASNGRVYGMALPGLAIVQMLRMLGGSCVTSYLTVRNGLVESTGDRRKVDIAFAVLCTAVFSAILV